MQAFYLLLLAFALGFVAAIPVGGSQIEMAKRAVAGNLRAALLVVLGSVSSDIVYGVIALFGIAPFMETPRVLAVFDVVAAGLLWILAFFTFRQSRQPHGLDGTHKSLRSGRRAYVTGFILAFSNPQMMLSWLLGVSLAKRLGIASPFPTSAKLLFVGGGALGLGGYLGLLAVFMYRVKHAISARTVGRVYFWLAVTLLLLSGYFVLGAVRYFVGGH